MKPSSFCFTSAPDHPTSNGELRHCRRLSRRTSLAAKTTIATKNLHLTDSMAPPGRLSLQSHTAAAFSPSKKKSSKRKKKNSPRTRERLRFRRRAPRMRRLRRASSPQMGARSRSGSARAARARPGARLKVGDGRAGGAGRRSGGGGGVPSPPLRACDWMKVAAIRGVVFFFFYGVLWAE